MITFPPVGGLWGTVGGENSTQRVKLLTFSGTLSVYNVCFVMVDEVILG